MIKNSKRFLKLLSVFSILLFYGCKKDKVGNGIDVISISLNEGLDSLGSHLYFNCSGGKYKCTNVGIRYALKIVDHNIDIDFGDTYYVGGSSCNDPGNTDTPPASAGISLGFLANANYDLSITCDGKTNHSTLIVSDSKFLIQGGNSSTIEFYLGGMEINRIPIDALWGDIYFSDTDSSGYFSFIDSLNSNNCVPYILPSGWYGAFYVKPDGSVTSNVGGTYHLRKYSGDIQLLRNIIHEFCPLNNNLHVSFYTGKGKHLSCTE